jgi:hypothetical protein
MSIPSTPPKYPSWSLLVAPIKEGASGWPVYALQSVLNVTADGSFGPQTLTALKNWQASHGLGADGVAGAKTQAAMLRSEARAVEPDFKRLPDGLLDGFCRIEGANVLAATNWYTPPGGKPGVDCGPVQWRQYGPPFDLQGLKNAFDPRAAFRYAAGIFTQRILDYGSRRPGLGSDRIARMAVLAHNAPFLSEQVVRYGHLLTPNAFAVWTTKPEGGHYTHAEWADEYPRRVLG